MKLFDTITMPETTRTIAHPLFFRATKDGSCIYLLGTYHAIAFDALPSYVLTCMTESGALCCENDAETSTFNREEFISTLCSFKTNNWYYFLSSEAKNVIDSYLEPYFLTKFPEIKLKDLHFKFFFLASSMFIQRNAMDHFIVDQFKNSQKPTYALDVPSDIKEIVRMSDLIFGKMEQFSNNYYVLNSLVCDSIKANLPELIFTGTIEQQCQLVSNANDGEGDLDLGEMKERNSRWKEILNATVTKHDQLFIAVGAGHLVGETGLLKWAEQSGYTVKVINDENCLFDTMSSSTDVLSP